MNDNQTYLDRGLAAARQAARDLARCDDRAIRAVLDDLARRALAHCDDILVANDDFPDLVANGLELCGNGF